jgi:hypothetical protein
MNKSVKGQQIFLKLEKATNTCKGCYNNWEPKREDVPTKYILKCESDGLNYFFKDQVCDYVAIYGNTEPRKGCVRRNLVFGLCEIRIREKSSLRTISHRVP